MTDADKGTERQAPSREQIRRWRQYLANERAEAATYRELAKKREGDEREILEKIAEAESRHEKYWHDKLGPEVGMPLKPDLRTRFMSFMARNFSPVFALALMQTAEQGSPYLKDADASDEITADEAMHAEVVRALATQGREKLSGSFRAAVFGANDGLVSNVALVLGVMGSGVSSNYILLTGISGLLAGALSMAAGEYISVKSQDELLDASTPDPEARELLPKLDVNENELALVYRARGMSAEEAETHANNVFWAMMTGHQHHHYDGLDVSKEDADEGDSSGAWAAASASFVCFAAGAFIPIIPFIFGLDPRPGAIAALVLVSFALLITGGITGLLSGKKPAARAFRQLAIGLGAAVVTYALGVLFGTIIG